jgi:hypothetical protein
MLMGGMPLKMKQKRDYGSLQHSPNIDDECHMEREKSILEITHSISHTATAIDVRISPEIVLHIPTNSLGK